MDTPLQHRPYEEVLLVVQPLPQVNWEARLHRWGLIPPWAKDPSIGNRMINARAETVATKPAFRRAFRERRCLVVADGSYEWQKQERRKQPYHIRLRDGGPFAFAGLWEHWESEEGAIDSCTLLTTTPNKVMRPLHDHIPMILPVGEYDQWLDCRGQDVEALQAILHPYPGDDLIPYRVSMRANNTANDSPACVLPLNA